MTRYNSRSHAIRNHKSGLAIADKIAGAMLIGAIVSGMAGMISYANWRDAHYLQQQDHVSVPTRPQDEPDNQPRTLNYLDSQPPA